MHCEKCSQSQYIKPDLRIEKVVKYLRISRLNTILAIVLLSITLIASFHFEAASGDRGDPQVSSLQASTYEVSASSTYIQEGLNTTLTVTVQASNLTAYYFKVNVTDPAGTSFAVNTSVTTNAVGFGQNSTKYWGDFSGAHTSLVGVYNILLKNATIGETLNSSNFTIGLTEKLNYRRNELVRIRGARYGTNESVTVDIKTSGSSVIGYSKNINASTSGIVNDLWQVPIEAALGVHTVTIVNTTTPGTLKTPSDTQNFAVFGVQTYSILPQPNRIQEGLNTALTVTLRDAAVNVSYPIRINVTSPSGKSHSLSRLIETNGTGFGSTPLKYSDDFAGANTYLVGTYTATVNETFASANFTVGLTDKTQYRRDETVNILAAGYNASEEVAVNLEVNTLSLDGFPINRTADNGGRVIFSWKIPINAVPGIYNLTLASAILGGTVKTPSDIQNFEVFGVVCKVQTKNLADATVNGVSVEVYKAGANSSLMSRSSNATGWIILNFDAGNYTFKTLWKGVQIANFNESIMADRTLNFTLPLTNVRITVRAASGGLPSINLLFSYNYTTRANENKSEPVELRTDIFGVAQIENVFSNLNYLLEARRYGFALPGTPLRNVTSELSWNNVVILVPTYMASVKVFDSKGFAVSDTVIAAYEWTSGITQRAHATQTSAEGEALLPLTFGKYRLRALYNSVVVNETTLDLIEDNLNFTFYLTIFNTDVTVWVRDYFAQPISNSNVTIERIVNGEYVFAYSQLTSGDGSIKTTLKVGGDSRISVYVNGKLAGIKTQFLSGKSGLVEFQVAENVAIFGYPISTGLFASLVFFIVIVGVILVLARGRLMKVFRKRPKK